MNTLSQLCRFSILCLLSIQLLGGSYGLVQTYAWIGMIMNYSQQSGVIDAVKDTFDGQHPCELCHHIDEQKNQSHEIEISHLVQSFKKLICPETLPPMRPRSIDLICREFPTPLTIRDVAWKSPPFQPPRGTI